MKGSWKEWALAAVFAWGLPWLVAAPAGKREAPAVPTETQAQIQTLPVLHRGEVVEMAWEDYLTGVLLGELPGSFSHQTKAAQAVVARTYALAAVERGVKHPGAVCTDSGCCQNWVDPDTWPNADHVASAREAVAETAGLVLTYQGQLIEATYFSCSGGRTEAAVAVWGSDIPYLQALDSPGEEAAAHFRDEKVFSEAAFLEALGLTGPLTLGTPTRTEGGGVEKLTICGEVFTGTRLRQLLGLRSTAFEILPQPGQLRIRTAGFGHRVGMSQYGAQAMAEGGSVWREILAYYYPGTEIQTREI